MRASTVYADGLSGGLASDGEGNVVEYYGTVRPIHLDGRVFAYRLTDPNMQEDTIP